MCGPCSKKRDGYGKMKTVNREEMYVLGCSLVKRDQLAT